MNVVEIIVGLDGNLQLVEVVPSCDNDSGDLNEILVLLENGRYAFSLGNNRELVVQVLQAVLLPLGWEKHEFTDHTSFCRQ